MAVNIKSFKRKIKQNLWEFKNRNQPKIFGVGNNKTGTTSLKRAMQDIGFRIGDQRTAERLATDWAKRDFKPIVDYCKTAEFFQDVPFSKPFTFVALDQAYPDSKFILTIRDNPEQWYNSLTKFHAKLWGKDGSVPTKEDLKVATYIYKGLPWEMNRYSYDTPENDPYNKDVLIQSYLDYNHQVADYFRHRPNDLLVLNISKPGAYIELCKFLGIKSDKKDFPWENKTDDLKNRN